MTTSAKRLLTQLNQLNSSVIEDVAILSSDNPYEVNAILFGPTGTPYANGAFRIRLTYGSDYPASPPQGHFLTKIHHPNVSSKGDICVNTLKRDWTPEVTISHILTIIKCLLISPGPDSALNEAAGKQLMESYDEFAKVARMWTSVHAIKVDRAIAEVQGQGCTVPPLSCGVKVLGDASVNKPGLHAAEDAHDQKGIKKVKTVAITAETKKKMDAKKKTLRRL